MPDKDSSQLPAPEELKPQGESSPAPAPTAASDEKNKKDKKDGKVPQPKRRGSYRPSHKATFLALIVVILILLVNGGVIGFILMRQSSISQKVNNSPVAISANALAKLGVSNTPVSDKGITLTVNPNAQFNGNVQIAGSTSIGGQLTLNNKFTATSASFNELQAGNTSLSQLNVNGSGTLSSLNLRQNLAVAGTTQLQGDTDVSGLLTAAGITVTGNLAVGGSLSVNNFHTGNLTVDSTLVIGGHIVTSGGTPSVSGVGCDSIGAPSSGNSDTAGAFTISSRGCSGELASLSFASSYSSLPSVVISPVSVGSGMPAGVTFYVSSISAGGFSVAVSGTLPAGVYNIDYIVEQ